MAFKIVIVALMAFSASTVFGKESMVKSEYSTKHLLQRPCLVYLQKQINEEMHASIVYMNMAAHFDNLDIARKGFAKFFEESSKEEREHAKKLIDYINLRGSTVEPLDIKMPESNDFDKPLSALQAALALEIKVNAHLNQLHDKANLVCFDAHLMDFIEHEFLNEQIESIAELRRYITVLSSMDIGMGEYLLDKELKGEKIEL